MTEPISILTLIFLTYFDLYSSNFILLFTPLESVVIQLFSFNFDFHFIFIFIFYHFIFDSFSKVRIFFHQAQRFGANVSKSAYFSIRRKGLTQTFQSPHIFPSGAKVWRKHFKVRIFFHQAQRFGANISKSAYFSSSAKVWRKHSLSAPIFLFRRK